jgi:hypothetical protein
MRYTKNKKNLSLSPSSFPFSFFFFFFFFFSVPQTPVSSQNFSLIYQITKLYLFRKYVPAVKSMNESMNE